MIRKILTFSLLSLFFSTASFSQRLMHSAGSTASILFGDIKDQYYSYSFSLTQTNLTYFPRYNFVEGSNTSVSIGAPVSVGVGIYSSYNNDDVGISFAYDLPAVVDFNFGAKSTANNIKKYGGYVGAGFGYYKVSISQTSYSNFNGATYGPIFRGGARFGFSAKGLGAHAISLGLFYKKGIDKNKLNTVGLSLMFDI
jgi:hypothetical protein